MLPQILVAVKQLLAAICLNPVACACQVFMMMKPSWTESLPDEMSKCRGGDVFTLTVDRILALIVQMTEGIINEYTMSFLRNAIGWSVQCRDDHARRNPALPEHQGRRL